MVSPKLAVIEILGDILSSILDFLKGFGKFVSIQGETHKMIRDTILIGSVVLIPMTACQAQDHSVIALSHTDHTVYEVSPTLGIINQFTAENQPHEGTATPNGDLLFIAIPNGPHVVILDTETFTEIGKIESDYFYGPSESSASPHGVAVNSTASKLYIGVENAAIPGVVVYDIEGQKVSKKIDLLLEGGHFLAIDHQTDKLYYPMRTDNRVVVLDTETDEVTKIISVEGGPVGVAFSPEGEAWVHSDYDGSVTVIDMETDEVVEVIQTSGEGAGRIDVSSDGRFAASTRGGTEDVYVIDTHAREVVAAIPLGTPGSAFPLFSPDSEKLYVQISYRGTSRGGEVVIIDLDSMEIENRYDVGSDPFGGTILNR